MTLKILTIGAFGYDEISFFEALIEAQVDLLVDIRRRRAVRGAHYAFANSERLQARLAELNIRYQHWIELAPSPLTRQIQTIHDRTTQTHTRQRRTLSPAYIEAYRAECLDNFDPYRRLATVGDQTRVLALFCVEQDPAACHRSLVADAFAAAGFEVAHLTPPKSKVPLLEEEVEL
jgi:uncharacterized protein (DUF488 family)